jgi:nitrous oxidase accessory protein
MGKGLALLLATLFLTSLLILQPATVKAQSKIIIVPDNCPTITSAIENATAGDTIIVKSGTYVENAITTNKSLSIKGAGSETTIVNFTSRSYEVDVSIYEKYIFYDPALSVYANNFMISGFTINSNGGEININGNGTQVTANNVGTKFDVSGSYFFITGNMFSQLNLNANYSKISSNVITDGISIGGQHTIFSLNNITNSVPSIGTNDSLIYGNTVDQASFAILPLDENNNIFSRNIIDHLSTGLWVRGLNNTILLNQITHCGIALQPSPNNTYYANQIANNLWGISTIDSQLNPNGNSSSFLTIIC